MQEITNQLTEGVSKFTLFVVTKKERAEAIPPNLSNGVDVVGNQCQTLVQLARELAGEYSDFPHIEASILSECCSFLSSSFLLFLSSFFLLLYYLFIYLFICLFIYLFV